MKDSLHKECLKMNNPCFPLADKGTNLVLIPVIIPVTYIILYGSIYWHILVQLF